MFSEVLRLWPLVGSADRRSVATYDFGPTYPGSKDRLIVSTYLKSFKNSQYFLHILMYV